MLMRCRAALQSETSLDRPNSFKCAAGISTYCLEQGLIDGLYQWISICD